MNAAKAELDLADQGTNGNPIISQVTLSAIAFGDALSIKYGGILNTQDHAGIVKAVQKAMGARADNSQMQRLGQIIARKSVAQYDFGVATMEEARSMFDQLERFARWAIKELARP